MSSQDNPRRRRIIIAAGAVTLVLLAIGAFMVAFSPSDIANSDHMYFHDGEMWKDASSPSRFPTFIGHPGTFSTGLPANFAQEMKTPPSPTRGGEPIATNVPGYGAKFNPFRHMGPLTPYLSLIHI